MAKTVEGASAQPGEIRELDIHEYELVSGGDGDGDGDNSEAWDTGGKEGESGGSLQNGNNTRAGDNNNGN